MANWYGTSRSNYFRVKDKEAFFTWAKQRGLGVFKNEEYLDLFAVHAGESTDDGSWPGYDAELDTEIDFVSELASHLCKGQIAILMEAGAEKLRYVTGVAVAVNANGRVVDLSLSDIYRKASRTFRIPENQITRAEY